MKYKSKQPKETDEEFLRRVGMWGEGEKHPKKSNALLIFDSKKEGKLKEVIEKK